MQIRLSGGVRTKLLLPLAGLFIAIVLSRLVIVEGAKAAVLNERHAFQQLAEYLEEYLSTDEEGVLRAADGHNYASSFQCFFSYMQRTHPEVTAGAANADNPFPGVLPRGAYGHADSAIVAPDALILWSQRVYSRPIGQVQFRLKCDAGIFELVGHDAEFNARGTGVKRPQIRCTTTAETK